MQKIIINGKEYPCRPTMGAFRRFKAITGYDISKADPDDVADNVVFCYCCIASACAADNVSFELDVDQFADMMDQEALNVFIADQAADAAEIQPQGDGSKKK
ncbi:MAG: hypothetical protein J6N54_04230 [Bacteroidales bacterium]|nr:hypothetical protein [Bacteroidales bacterium]